MPHPEHPLHPGWLQCNRDHPMPRERDQMGPRWMHDETRSDGFTVLCLACGYSWAIPDGVRASDFWCDKVPHGEQRCPKQCALCAEADGAAVGDHQTSGAHTPGGKP